jgi:hypothetical protein
MKKRSHTTSDLAKRFLAVFSGIESSKKWQTTKRREKFGVTCDVFPDEFIATPCFSWVGRGMRMPSETVLTASKRATC